LETRLQKGETVIKEGRANLQRGIEAVGGKLYLSSRRLIFESHRFSVQTGDISIPLDDVALVRKCWTKFLNLIPLFPNSIGVTVREGTQHRIVVTDRDSWVEAIEAAAPEAA
jgi:hypothetical protein